MTKHIAILTDQTLPSITTAQSVAAALAPAYRVTSLDYSPDLAADLRALAPDAVFLALSRHTNGTVQGLLEHLQLPYTHSGILASALAADRHQAKVMFRATGIPVTDHVVADRADAARTHVMPPPYVVKPVIGRSPLGTFAVMHAEDLPPAQLLHEDWGAGEEVLVERHIPGRTLACAVMGDVALGVTEIVVEKDGLAEESYILPAELKPKIYDKVQKMSLKAHAALGCRGVSRTDFRYNDLAGEDGELVCLGLTTQPHMSETSLVSAQALHAGHSFAELVAWIVEDASCNR